MDPKKQIVVNSLLSFLQEEVNSSISPDKKESIEVAIQCLETAFEIDGQSNTEKVDLLSLINVKPVADVTEEKKAQAEGHKNKGNTFMKNSEYSEAVAEYSKAIELNPYNAVYYCNRAAAYTRLVKDNDAINDCNEAIKLDSTYGKAYGRLGIAYSNLNKYDEAYKAYQTALKYDPNNAMYETNLKLAQERLNASGAEGGEGVSPVVGQVPESIAQFMNNPNVINMATQILSDPSFCNMMSGFINMGGSGDNMPNAIETMLQAGQTLAQRVVNEDPNFYNRITRNFQNVQGAPEGDNSSSTNPNSNDQQPDNKDNDQGSA